MSRTVVIDALLALAVVVVLFSSIGLVVMKDVYQRVHYVTPIAVLAPFLVAVAVTIRQGWDENTGQTWMAVALVLIMAPVISHATMRTARIRDTGDWRDTRSARSKRRDTDDAL